jgi:hypothetical protein
MLAPANAQSTAVVPTIGSGDANSAALVAGFDGAQRHQYLFDASVLAPVRNRALLGMTFRRDAGSTSAFSAGEADLEITLSIAPHQALDASEDMDRNLDPLPQNRLLVFQGRALLPASAAAAGRAVSWSDPQDVVDIAFARPFPYLGGTLTIDIVGRPVAGRTSDYWAVDALADDATGTVTYVGTACGRFGGAAGPQQTFASAHTSPRQLVPGFTVSFTGLGDVATPAALLLGFTPALVDLHALGLGGPGCKLYVHDAIALSGTFLDRGPSRLPGGEARIAMQVPVSPSVLGARFRAQFAQVTTPILTSNALDCAIASRLPSLGLASVLAPIEQGVVPTRGRVLAAKGPVVRFRY